MLEPLLRDRPGVRCPTVATVFESCVRAVLGQQVSTEAARRLCGKLLQACNSYLEQDGKPVAVFPLPQQLAALPDSRHYRTVQASQGKFEVVGGRVARTDQPLADFLSALERLQCDEPPATSE